MADNNNNTENATDGEKLDFVRSIVAEDIKNSKHAEIITRFPPEPNGYLHIGHAKSICLNFGIAQQFSGKCNLRFDDTNPTKEEQEYVDSIMADINWLGFKWDGGPFFASDYFDTLYGYAVDLIKKGLAYVCELNGEQMSEYRGTLTSPGKNSPYRDRSIEENLELFERMKAGEFPDGSHTLRAKIDMASPNMNMRDPVLYRILHASHHRTGDKWCIYPMYDFTHGQSDSIEGITHSICTLEFENHRPLYDWFLEKLEIYAPRQIEFARLELTYMMMSKRRLLQLVTDGHVSGWDDPRMPTLSGLRRRGFTPAAIRSFCRKIGVAKFNSVIDIQLLEQTLREDLNERASRVMAVLDPLKVVITNYDENAEDMLEAMNHPQNPDMGSRQVPFSRELYIERGDFMEDPPRKFKRLSPGVEVRLRYGFFITCTDVIKDADGNVTEVHCTYDPATRGGDSPDGRKVKGTIHWVSAKHAIDAEVRQYDHLFNNPDPSDFPEGKDFTHNLNPESLVTLTGCKLEPSLADAKCGTSYQFERTGYFCVDSKDSAEGKYVFNRTVSLRDSWAKMQKK